MSHGHMKRNRKQQTLTRKWERKLKRLGKAPSQRRTQWTR